MLRPCTFVINGRDPFNQNFRMEISVQNSVRSVRSNRKSFEKTGPHLRWSTFPEFRLNEWRPIITYRPDRKTKRDQWSLRSIRLLYSNSCVAFLAPKLQSPWWKEITSGVLVCFQFERKMTGNMNFLHSRLLVNALEDRPTDILMRREAGRSCDDHIKCELWSLMIVIRFFGPLIKGVVSLPPSSFCLILPITRTQSLWNLK